MNADIGWWFASGHAVDLVLVVLTIEAVWLFARGAPASLLLMLAPGACMMLALRAALTGAPWPWVALPLTVSLPFHLADLRHRLRG